MVFISLNPHLIITGPSYLLVFQGVINLAGTQTLNYHEARLPLLFSAGFIDHDAD